MQAAIDARIREVRKGLNRTGFALGLIHLALAIWGSTRHDEGSWGYILFVVPDLPVVLVITLLNRLFSFETAWPLLIVLGTLWWYLVGTVLERAFVGRNNNG